MKRFLRAMWLWWDSRRDDQRRHDEELLVAFLAERGPSSVMAIKLYMKDFTFGREDWFFSRSDRYLYRLLDRMESIGTVAKSYSYGWDYRLAIPKDRLIRVK